eukprot:superscaffoldBa00012296_g25600
METQKTVYESAESESELREVQVPVLSQEETESVEPESSGEEEPRGRSRRTEIDVTNSAKDQGDFRRVLVCRTCRDGPDGEGLQEGIDSTQGHQLNSCDKLILYLCNKD